MRPVSRVASASWTAGKVSRARQWVTAGRPAGDHGHALAVPGVAADGGVDRALGGGEAALDQGQVAALDPVGGQVAGQGQVGGVVLGHQQQPGGVLVEPVDDAGAVGRSPAGRQAGPFPAQEGVDQGAGGVAGAGVDDQAGRLGHHQQPVVLVADGQGPVLGHRGAVGRGRRRGPGEPLATPEPVRLGPGPAVHLDQAVAGPAGRLGP